MEGWRVDTPSLFLRGSESDYVDDPYIEVIHRHFSQAQVKTLDGAGHWLHAEQPQVFLQRVLAFLDET